VAGRWGEPVCDWKSIRLNTGRNKHSLACYTMSLMRRFNGALLGGFGSAPVAPPISALQIVNELDARN